jgi:diguanylate cyclase (GGDEF)-like protein
MNQRLGVFFSCNISLLLLLLLIAIGIRHPVLQRFALLEKSLMEQQLSRVTSGLADELDRIDAKVRSEATWSEMYNYVINRNPDFYNDNYTYAGLSPAFIDMFGILDSQGNPIHLDWLNHQKQKLYTLTKTEISALLTNQTLSWLSNTQGKTLSSSRNLGFVMTQRGLLLLATRPILTSNGHGPSRGTVLVGRLLNQSVLEQFERHSNLKLHLLNQTLPVQHLDGKFDKTDGYQSIRQAPKTVKALNNQYIAGYINIIDIKGESIKVLSVMMPRLEYAEGERVLNHFTIILFITGSLLGIIISYLIDKLIRNNQQIKRANQELILLANIDGLTLIQNRRSFDNYLQQEWHRAVEEQHPLTVILCDVDYFKAYNDNYGHQAGDECLRQLARVISCTVTDINDFVARYGGEEFAVILPNKDVSLSMVVAENMLKNVQKLQLPHAKSSISPYVSLSIGIASIIPTEQTSPETLIQQSDSALYTAKSQGRNQIVCFKLD